MGLKKGGPRHGVSPGWTDCGHEIIVHNSGAVEVRRLLRSPFPLRLRCFEYYETGVSLVPRGRKGKNKPTSSEYSAERQHSVRKRPADRIRRPCLSTGLPSVSGCCVRSAIVLNARARAARLRAFKPGQLTKRGRALPKSPLWPPDHAP